MTALRYSEVHRVDVNQLKLLTELIDEIMQGGGILLKSLHAEEVGTKIQNDLVGNYSASGRNRHVVFSCGIQ